MHPSSNLYLLRRATNSLSILVVGNCLFLNFIKKKMSNLQEILVDKLKSDLPGYRKLKVCTLISNPTHCKPPLYPYSQDLLSNPPFQKLLITFAELNDNDSLVFTCSTEIHVYHLDKKFLIYVSKVDTTGYGKSPSPLNVAIESVLEYYNKMDENIVWVSVFARAQHAYLFPNSDKNDKKRVLSDSQLQKWWKLTLNNLNFDKKWFFLPGYTKDEASSILKCDNGWIYGNPYQSLDFNNFDNKLSNLIPNFDDDPKSRFLEELANSIEALDGRSLKKVKRNTHSIDDKIEKKRDQSTALNSTTLDEFWERLGFRQECSSGRVTGFFYLSLKKDNEIISKPNEKLISIELFHRLLGIMMNSEFESIESTQNATKSWLENIEKLIDDVHTIFTPLIEIKNEHKLIARKDKSESHDNVKPQVLTVRKKKRPANEN